MMHANDHLVRAARHRKVGDALADAGDEWGLVCYFYAAFHLVRFSLLSDPIFDSPQRLSALTLPLLPDDRNTERHHGRGRVGQPREWGVNELVGFLYKHVRVDYETLHVASIEVRYAMGQSLPTLAHGSEALGRIERAQEDGTLRAP